MSDYPPASYGMGYGAHDQSNAPYVQPTYPAQYMPPNDGRMAQGNIPASYDASMSSYGYNAPAPSFSAAAIASGVPPLPIFQGWNQDVVPLPPYQPANGPSGLAYNSYSENTHPNGQYYAPSNQHAYQQNVLVTKPFDEGEVSEGEFEPAAANIPSTSYSSNQYRSNDGGEYSEPARRTVSYAGAPSQAAQQQYNTVNNYSAPARNSPRPRRDQPDTYSPYNSPRPVETTKPKSTSSPHTQSQSQGSILGAPRDYYSSAQNGVKVFPEPSSYSNGHGTLVREDYLAKAPSSFVPVPSQKSLINSRSVETMRNEAGKAVLQLSPLLDYVQFQDYLDEGIRENVLTALYSHLKLPIQSSVKPGSVAARRDRHASSTTLKAGEALSLSRPNGPSGQESRFSRAPAEQPGARGISALSQVNGKQAGPVVTDIAKGSTVPPPGVAAAPAKPVAMSEKERTLQSKMEALRKSREERAQKQAAKNNPKSPVEVSSIQASTQSQSQPAALIPGLKPLSIPSEHVKTPVQSASSSSAISSLSMVQTSALPAPPPPTTVIPGLFLASTVASPASATNVQSTPVPAPPSTQRKRPVAADFDTPITLTPFKRPFGQSRNERPLVIDVSDEEVDSEDEDVEMDLESQADQESPMQTARTMSDHRSMAIQNLPQLSDFQPRKPFTPPNSSAATTPPILQGTSKAALGRPEILQRKESEIEILKKKIAEAEAKKKARQTPTGTQTPRAVLEVSNAEIKANLNNGNLASKVEASKKIQELIGIVNNKTNNDQQKLAEAHAAEDEEAAELKRNEDERKRLRRQKIASELPLVDAKVQETQARLDQMRAETARLEVEYLSNVEAKRIMAEEMERLGQEAEDELQEVKNKLQVLTKDESGNNDVTINPPVVAIPEEIINSSTPAIVALTTEDEPQSAEMQAREAETADVEMSGEISLHDPLQNDGQAVSNVTSEAPISIPKALDAAPQEASQDGKDQVSDDRALEAALQEAVRVEADSHTQEEVDMEASFAPEPSQLALASSSNLADEEPQSPDYSPVLHRTVSDTNDAESDTYEPPEATPPIDAPALIESPPFSPAPPDTISESAHIEEPMQVIDNQAEDGEVLPEPNGSTKQVPQLDVVEAGGVQLFTPYKSPLKQFHAYRFHPNYEQEVPGGLRSLTYSHKIQADKEFCRYELAGGVCNDKTCESQHFSDIKILDDGILSTLGSPDQFTGTQREEYCSGLRGVLQDLRARKIRAFDVIAPEIVAFRSKFLGDPSKVLNLEGTTI